MKPEYFVYIIYSRSTGKFYTGQTINLTRCIKEHIQKLSNTLSTKNVTDFELTFCQIEYSRFTARKLEKYLKSGAGREIRQEIVEYLIARGDNPLNKGL